MHGQSPLPHDLLSVEEFRVFREAARILTTSADLESALQNAITACLPALGDFGFFDVVLPEGVRRTARAYDNDELERILSATAWQRNERQDMNLCALSSGEAVLHPDTNDEWYARAFGPGQRFIQFTSMLSVPVAYGDELIGSLTLFMGDSGRRHATRDLQFAGELSSLAAPVVVKARLEALQQASEARFRLALKVGGMGAWEWNMLENRVFWWPGMAELHGMPPGSQLGKVQDYLNLVHPDDRALAGRSLGGQIDSETGKGIEYRIIWPDGSVHWIEGKGDVVRNGQGQVVSMSGICVDVTKRKLTEQKLRFLAKASAELAELVEREETLVRIARLAVPDFADWCTVDLVDGEGALKRVAVAHVDPQKVDLARRLHERYPPDPDTPNSPWQVIRAGKAALVKEITDEALMLSLRDTGYLQIIRELGLRSYMAIPLIVRGHAIGAITFTSAESRHLYSEADVEIGEEIGRRAGVAIENAGLYQSLQESDRRKDDFLAMLAHELRNPLAPVSAAAHILTLKPDPAVVHKSAAVIARQVAHLTGLVDDLLDISRVSRGLIKLDMTCVDLRAAIEEAVEQVRPLMDRKEQRLDVAIQTSELRVQGDHKRLVQVMSNLLNNAAKFTPPSGRIRLQAGLDGDSIAVAISDDGIGMPPELLSAAFELFVQGKTTVDRATGGLGIGLALVKHMVGLHGGTVTARSEGVGRGSEFVVRLPAGGPERSEVSDA
ncbi:hypothetical protein GCM10027277_41650 [Pseudoduganella ginsengisoli]|uniref:histidine kinase n=1 Tax=Pseudoduganella ginsengisoli TaxID=1462440 RepID=A0A6L6PW81_9BURK|nr:GAF domain-containing sensor histidine kinase [Pseudoduganella ginsengisoli]MTW01767.1 GAF domain-containing protein [Pseudoduganella ginsengisoli]